MESIDTLISRVALNTGVSKEAVIETALLLLSLENGATKNYTLKELAAEWKCSYQFLYGRVQRGTLKATKIGKEWKVSLEDKIAFENNLKWNNKRHSLVKRA